MTTTAPISRDDGGALLRELTDAPALTVYRSLASSPKGLTEAEAADRLRRHGDNVVETRPEAGFAARAAAAVRSPFVALLSALAGVFVVVGDARGAVTVAVVVVLSIALRSWQHLRSDRAARALQSRVRTTASVRRRAEAGHAPLDREVPVEDLVPGDVVVLGPGDVVPADVRVVSSHGLKVDQAGLSGESLPVDKRPPSASEPRRRRAARAGLFGAPSLCFTGTSVVAGTATAVVVFTGRETCFGALAAEADRTRPESSFDRGVRAVGWTLMRFTLVMVPIVLAVNGAVTGDWAQAALFAAAVAVGLTPEMLPVVVTGNLVRGASRLARRQVVVTRLNAIQDLGAMDVLCVDKTGTLTEDRAVFAHSVDADGRVCEDAAEYAWLAVRFQDAPHNRLDEAVAAQLAEPGAELLADALYGKVDEIGFDPARRLSTVVFQREDEHLLITKGDPDEVLRRCTHLRRGEDAVELDRTGRLRSRDVVRAHAQRGMRVLAVAARRLPARPGPYDETDELALTLVGFVGFVDPVRESAAEAVRALSRHGVAVTIVTGDNEHAAARVAQQVGVPPGEVVPGRDVEAADDAALRRMVARTTVFAEVTPAHKTRIVAALRARGHVVGVIGDGVNDAPALRVADVGIAAERATGAAKRAADLLLTDSDLAVVARGVVEGRRTLGNTLKYVKITAASNFGNVLTVLAASVFLPFLPMLPIQLVVQNLLYDAAQLVLPHDRVDADYLRAPRRWDTAGLAGFMLLFGPLSSVFDLATFAVLWWPFGAGGDPALFQTGWFVEGLLSQVLVVLVLRTRGAPLRGNPPARPVVLAAAAVAAVGLLLPFTPPAGLLHLRPLPASYLIWLVVALTAYGVAAQLVKTRAARRRVVWP
ncbi:magnesium-translocating P-type ATPase [Saccharopolyspora rosea]|uniref:magnesium-translocating P-type ATPase n=1 Tax=Saccharopolyspora rosea TaxID=524884 RepID=UPI0021DA44A5|nr:magnesium-translocating P-type ATPase [Saccharopolyspora rosea]